MMKLFTAVLLLMVSAIAFANAEDEMGVFDMKIVKDGELITEPMMVGVYLNKPRTSPGPATVTVGDDDGHTVRIALEIRDVEETGAQVVVEYGYGKNGEDDFTVQETVTLPWSEETRLDYQRDSRSPSFEFFVTLTRESEQRLRARMEAYTDKSSD